MRTVREVMVAWGEAWNGHDADALAALYHDDAVNHQVAFGDPRVGRDAMREDFRAFFAAFPDSYTRVEVTLIDGARAAVEWVGGATWTGPFAGRAPTGAPFTLRGAGSSSSWTARSRPSAATWTVRRGSVSSGYRSFDGSRWNGGFWRPTCIWGDRK